MEMLEASMMDRTDVTQGDLEELCESSLSGNMRQEGVPSSNPRLLDLGFATSPSGELLTPGEGSTHTPASVESASRTLTETTSSNPGLLDLGFATSPSGELLKPGEGITPTPASMELASRTLTETTGLEAWLVRVKEAEEAAQQSNNNNTGCAINEGEENMNIQGSNRFL